MALENILRVLQSGPDESPPVCQSTDLLIPADGSFKQLSNPLTALLIALAEELSVDGSGCSEQVSRLLVTEMSILADVIIFFALL